MASRAPTPAETVRHFLSTLDDYCALHRTYPLPPNVDILGFPGEQTRWTVRLHALLLRKYFAPNDPLHLPRVVDAVQLCVRTTEFPVEDWVLFRESTREPYETGVRVSVDGKSFNEAVLLENELYGRFLHGDYDKWVHTQSAGDDGSDALIYMATWNRAAHVTSFADLIRHGISNGSIELV